MYERQGTENVFWEIRSLQKFSNLSGQLYWDPSVWSSGKNLETTDTKWALKTSGVSSDGRLLFAGLWLSVLIALHMDDISALFLARSLKKKILASLTRLFTRFPHLPRPENSVVQSSSLKIAQLASQCCSRGQVGCSTATVPASVHFTVSCAVYTILMTLSRQVVKILLYHWLWHQD